VQYILKAKLRFFVVAAASMLALLHPLPANADDVPNRTYQVKSGDTIANIAAAFAISPAVIIDLNNLREQGGIHVGEELKLPATASNVARSAQIGEDAKNSSDLNGGFDSLEGFNKVANEVADTGVPEQASVEHRLRGCIEEQNIPLLREALRDLEKLLPTWTVEQSIFNDRTELDGFIHLAYGLIDQADGDVAGYGREMKEAYRIAPEDAKVFGKIVVEGHARRGLILDINQKSLADNAAVSTVVADGSALTNREEAVAVLAGLLELDAATLETKLSSVGKYIVVKKYVPETTVAQIKSQLSAKSVQGITFEPELERLYPTGSEACHVIGFVNSDQQGVQGIERVEDDYLRGRDGLRFPNNYQQALQDGYNVRLTIDLNLQNIVETELDAACAEFKPKKAIVVLMRPQTGEILAMANRPNFNPNDLHEKPWTEIQEETGDMKNRAITDQMEPGSAFMFVPLASALNEHVVRPDSVIFCENGRFGYGGRLLHDYRPWGDLTAADILVKSSNIGAAKLAMRLGEQRLYDYIRAFGFGERTGLALSGEIRGTVFPPRRWDKLAITRIPIGYEVAVTPIQLITAMCAIANGGHLMMPQIVHDVTDENGVVIKRFPPVEVRQVVSGETAREVTDALKDVVTLHGTAPLAMVPGFTVAGKTGTAEKIDPMGAGYAPGKYIVSFCGFLPANNPAFVGIVILDDPTPKPGQRISAGTVASPLFARIAGRVAHYLNLTPDATH